MVRSVVAHQREALGATITGLTMAERDEWFSSITNDRKLSAQEVIEAILPDVNARRLVMDRLIGSWEFAGTIAPAARSVTLSENGFRLNIGQVEALTFFNDTIRILMAAAIDDPRLATLPLRSTSYVSIQSPQCAFIGSALEYRTNKPLIDALHRHYVRSAATTSNGAPRLGSPYVTHHSAELISYAREFSFASPSGRSPPYPFNMGANYTRRDVFSVLGIPEQKGGPWFTGYTSHGPDWFIFCGIGTGGRTGHDYNNHFQGDDLVWFGKRTSGLGQPTIRKLLSAEGHVYVFYREDDRDPFTFAGVASPVQIDDARPVKVVWRFRSTTSDRPHWRKLAKRTSMIQLKTYALSVRIAMPCCIGGSLRWTLIR